MSLHMSLHMSPRMPTPFLHIHLCIYIIYTGMCTFFTIAPSGMSIQMSKHVSAHLRLCRAYVEAHLAYAAAAATQLNMCTSMWIGMHKDMCAYTCITTLTEV